MTVHKIESARGRNRSALYLVKVGTNVVGMLEKYRNTRTETHPWKAFLGTGLTATFLGAFYGAGMMDESSYPLPHHGDDRRSDGRSAALQAIADAMHATTGKTPAGADFSDVP